MMAVFVPPAIFDEVHRFHSPMVANVTKEVIGGDLGGIETGNEIANVVRDDLAVACAHLAIDAKRNLTIRKLERFAEILGVV